MKNKTNLLLLSTVAMALIGWGMHHAKQSSSTLTEYCTLDTAVKSEVAATAPQIEVCFVLDTTGSMHALIEGAKQKIWSLANEMVKAKPTPQLKVGLVAYRDKNDAYVTQSFPLTADLDAVYAQLQKFTADGGGDTPESVNEALADAVHKMAWNSDRHTLKIIFLVGDAPPHMDYANGPKFPNICAEAVKQDIIINTIQCGDIKETASFWTRIAQLSEGHYASIAQSGNVAVIAAPQDKELAELNKEIGQTLVAYGTPEQQREVKAKQEVSERSFASVATAPAAADRLLYNSTTRKTVQGGNDLVEDYGKDATLVGNIGKEKLPEPLQKMNTTELEGHLKTQQAKRAALQTRIDQVSRERAAFLEEEHKKLAARDGNKDSFDDEVARILRVEAAKKGLTY
ncbi:MAG: hypothetical protein B9S32_01935 [Verrucomicrobia bacterium Tous-C9LFEB]|nr:MAG: hypothetical protein B9S32_01935 [Verrucomicrobia bacterium Tous-C9LFEB]